jgi:hypothetical protein
MRLTTAIEANITASDPAQDNPLLRWIVRLRWTIFLFVAIIHLAAFNGQWRIGRDGSLYRAVAHNLASGEGYTFRGQRENHIYPGLPLLLAGIEKTFGFQDPLRPTASLIIMTLLGGVTLVVIYHLVRTYFPLWVAVCVTTGVGINREFLHYSHDLMTDLPFLLGACLTLLGIARFANSQSLRSKLWAAALAAAGAIIAVSTRPTFWALGVACAGACAVGIVRSPRRPQYIAAAAGIAALVLLWWALDPRTAGVHPLAGKYESVVATRLQHLADVDWIDRLDVTFNKHLPEAMLGFELDYGAGVIFSAALLLGAVLVLRTSPLWGLYILATVAMTFVIGSMPRYFLMALPLLLVAWAQTLRWLSPHASRWRYGPKWVMLIGLGLTTVPPLVRCIDLVLEQHGVTRNFKHKSFLEVYRGGKMLPVLRLAELVKQRVPQQQKILGPEPRILSFLSGRVTFDPSELVDARKPLQWQPAMSKYQPAFAIYGARFTKENLVAKMIAKKVLIADKSATVRLDDMYLAPIRVAGGTIPGLAKRLAQYHAATQPATRQTPATQHVTRKKKSTAATQPVTRPTRKRAVSTQPTTRPVKKHAAATSPATKRVRKTAATTHPTTRIVPRRARRP